MAVKEQILGSVLSVIYNGVVVACATEYSMDITAKELDASCAGSGDLEQAIPGRKKVTFDSGGLFRQTSSTDVATNKTVAEFFDDIMGSTAVTYVIGKATPATGDITYTLGGFLKNLKVSGNHDEVGKFSFSGWANTATKTVAS